jgi:hypothetical protein
MISRFFACFDSLARFDFRGIKKAQLLAALSLLCSILSTTRFRPQNEKRSQKAALRYFSYNYIIPNPNSRDTTNPKLISPS